MFKQRRHTLASIFTTMMLTACASPNQADSLYINTTISGELMPGVYGQVNIGSVPDYVTVYEEPMMIVQQPVYAVPMQPIYLYVPPYHAYHWRDHCGYYNACARPVYFVCARDYRPDYFEPRYYNTRVYDPPRMYHSHPARNRHYETMHQREMNRDASYHRLNDDNHGSHYRGSDDRWKNQGRGDNNHRDNNSHGSEYYHDNGNNQRRDDRGDKSPQRQQFINNYRNDDNRQQINRQQFTTTQPQRRDVMRVRSDDGRNNVRPADYRPPADNRVQMNNDRQRMQVPVQQSRQPQSQHVQRQPQQQFQQQAQPQRQPSFRAQQGQGSHGFGRQGGGQDERRREERR